MNNTYQIYFILYQIYTFFFFSLANSIYKDLNKSNWDKISEITQINTKILSQLLLLRSLHLLYGENAQFQSTEI